MKREPNPCIYCHGHGFVESCECDEWQEFEEFVECISCQGTGYVQSETQWR